MGIDHNAQSAWGFDVINTSDVGAHDGTEREVRGLPAFPVNFGKWESWIYPYVGNGIEIAFTDEVGTYDFDFAPAPNSRWRNFSPRRTIERVQSKTPSVYRHDYGGDPLDMHMVTADFRSLDRRMDDLTAYTGISMDDLTWSIVDADRRCANLEMEVAAFDSGMTRVYFDLYDTDVCVEDTVDHGRQAGHSLGGRADRCARSGGFHDRCSGQGSEDGPDTGDSAGGGCGGLQRAGVDVERPGHSHRCS
jgi:hypothetical protein